MNRHIQNFLGKIRFAILFLLLGILVASCSNQETDRSKLKKASFTSIAPKYAKGFSLDDYGSYQLLHILQPFNDKQDTITYLLYANGSEKPEGVDYLASIATPIQKMVVQSTTHIALADELNALEVISGMTSTQFVYNPTLKKRIEEGKVKEVGEGEQLSQENIMFMQPDLLMVSGFSSASFYKNYKNLIDAGVPVLINSDWMEQDMLGRAEWLKVLGYLLGKQDLANQQFEKIEKLYNQYAEIGRTAKEKPMVIGGLPFKGAWSVAGAKSYIAQLLTDAGAEWNWAGDSSSVSLQMDFESVYPIGLQAEYWVRVGTVRSKAELLAKDSRFEDFKSVQLGNLYNNTKRMTPDGLGNDYWESGLIKPHLILADIIKIIHPELLQEHELYFYERLKN